MDEKLKVSPAVARAILRVLLDNIEQQRKRGRNRGRSSRNNDRLKRGARKRQRAVRAALGHGDYDVEGLEVRAGSVALVRQYIHEYVRGREHARRAAATEAEEKRTRKRLKRYPRFQGKGARNDAALGSLIACAGEGL